MKLKILLIMFIILATFVYADSIDVYCENQISSKDVCIKDIAIQRQDIGYCNMIESVSVRNSCYGSFAKTSNDMELCAKLGKEERDGLEDRYECYLDFVNDKEDMYICDDLIKDDDIKDDCYSEILDEFKDISMCEKFISNKKMVSCYRKIAISEADESICDKILEVAESNIKSARYSFKVYSHEEEDSPEDDVKECKLDIRKNKIKKICRDYDEDMEVRLRQKAFSDLKFRDDDEKDEFRFTLKWVEYDALTVDFEVATGTHRESYRQIPLGNVIKINKLDLGIQPIDAESENDENFAEFCLVKLSSNKELLKQQERAQEEEEVEEEPEPVVEENITEENITQENITEEKPVVKVEKKQGFFSRIGSWFMSLFGFEKN